MKNILPILFGVALLPMAVQATSTSNVVGYHTIDLPGTGGVGTEKLQIASQGLLSSGAQQTSGTITGVGNDVTLGDYIVDSSGTWTAGDYVGTEFDHVVEITSGALAGSMTWITASDDSGGAGQRLYTGDDLAAANGESYRVLKTFTISSLLGNPPTAAVLGGAGSSALADNFLILDPTTGNYTTFWYKNSGIGQGWKSDDAGIVDVPNYGIFPTDGMLWLRKQSGDGEIIIAGGVKDNLPGTEVLVYGDGATEVLNILTLHFPVDQLTLTASGIYTADANTGLKGAGSSALADNLLILDTATGNYTTFWFKNSGIGQGWKSDDAGIVDVPNYVIPAGSGVLILRKVGPSFSWSVPAVTTN